MRKLSSEWFSLKFGLIWSDLVVISQVENCGDESVVRCKYKNKTSYDALSPL